MAVLIIVLGHNAFAQTPPPGSCPEILVIDLDNLPPGPPPWLVNGVIITWTGPYLPNPWFDVVPVPGGLFVNNAILGFDLSGLNKTVIGAEIDIIDYCAPACTQAGMWEGPFLVDQTGNIDPGNPETLHLFNLICADVDSISLAGLETLVSQLRLYLFCVECPPDMGVCEDDPPIDLNNLGASPAGGTFEDPFGNFIGVFDPSLYGPGIYDIEYCYEDPISTCEECCTFTIEVFPLPTVTCPADFTVCENDGLVALVANPPGGVFMGPSVIGNSFDPSIGQGTYTIQYCYTDLNGCEACCFFNIIVLEEPTAVCGDIFACISDPLVPLNTCFPAGGTTTGPGIAGGFFNPNLAGVGTHTLNYNYVDPFTGCETDVTFQAFVFALPVVNCPPSGSVCINNPPFMLSGATPAGGTYSGPGVVAGQFNPAAAGVGIHTITYSYTDPFTGCSNSCTFIITVNPLPVVSCPANFSVSLATPPFLLFGGSPAGGNYSGPGVSMNFFDPSVAGPGSHVITYTYTDGNGCTNFCTFIITVTDQVLYEFGDAPEGVLAYPTPPTPGNFPTCSSVGPPLSFIRHDANPFLFFGPGVDYEPDGNAGNCPAFQSGLYDQDECWNDGDAGLLIPPAFTIKGPPGGEYIELCDPNADITTWKTCREVVWGVTIDMFVTNNLPDTAYFNLLVDWNMDGTWGGILTCPNNTVAEEHAIVNFKIPPGFSDTLSKLSPPAFRIGPMEGYVWARFSLTEIPVPLPWDGSGMFVTGETEDYLLALEDPNLQTNLTIDGVVFPPGTDICLEAEMDIIIQDVTIENGAKVIVTAGNSILILPHTHIQAGAEFLAVIDQNGNFCSNYKNMLFADEEIAAEETAIYKHSDDAMFRVYPNPTPGHFKLDVSNVDEMATVVVEIYNMVGERILRKELPAMHQYNFDLTHQQPGIYLIRLMNVNHIGVEKIIRR
jgi:hypothetical protein